MWGQERRDWSQPSLHGTCSEMCPKEEIVERQRFNRRHELERDQSDPSSTAFMIKEYFRTVPERMKQPQYLRNREGIAKSMDRLRQVMDQKDVAFEKRGSFIWDRYRAIWKDMSMQDWKDIFRVSVLEEMSRFLIFTDFELARMKGQMQGLNYQDTYDSELGIQLLLQCFVTLSELYEELRHRGEPCPNEFEFRVYHALLQMMPVDGRSLLHNEIASVFERFTSDIFKYDTEKVESLKHLYASMKKERLKQIAEVVWVSDFFEFALQRRIVQRYRTVRFIRFFKDLKRRNEMDRHPPMSLDEFCIKFFLTKSEGVKFAKAHKMEIVCQDDKEDGYKNPDRSAIPAVGCGLQSWGFLARAINVSDFVIQHPTEPSDAKIDFAYAQLMWPSYTAAQKEWTKWMRSFKISEHQAAVCYLHFWQRYNRLEIFKEIPQVSIVDEQGVIENCTMPLPHFRTVEHRRLAPAESVGHEQVASLRQDQMKISTPSPALGTKTEALMNVDHPTVCHEVEDGEIMENSTKDQTTDRKFDDGYTAVKNSVRQTLPLDAAPPARYSLSSGPADMSRTEFVDLTERTTSSCQPQPPVSQLPSEFPIRYVIDSSEYADIEREVELVFNQTSDSTVQISRGTQCDAVCYNESDKKRPSLALPVQEEKYVPDDAEERFHQHVEKYTSDLNADMLLGAQVQFYSDYSDRAAQIKAFEMTIPSGWRMSSKQKEELKDVKTPWKDPDLIPCFLPPRLTNEHLLELLKRHAATKNPIISRQTKLQILSNSDTRHHYCNLVLLQNGPLEITRMNQVWLGLRLFGDPEYSEDTDLSTVQDASVLILLLDDHREMKQTVENLRDALQQTERRLPVIVFDALQTPYGVMHEDTALNPEDDGEGSDKYDKITSILASVVSDICFVDFTGYLEVATRSVHRYLTNSWQERCQSKPSIDARWRVKSDTCQEERFDPLQSGLDSVRASIVAQPEALTTNAADLRSTSSPDQLHEYLWLEEWRRIGSNIENGAMERFEHLLALNPENRRYSRHTLKRKRESVI